MANSFIDLYGHNHIEHQRLYHEKKMNWTQEQIDKLTLLYPQGYKVCMEALGKSRTSIKSMACRLKITNHKLLTIEEIDYLKQNGDKKSVVQLCKEMKRSWQTIGRFLKKMGIKFLNPQGKWMPNEEEVQILRSNISFHEMSVQLKRSIPTIRIKMREMSLIDPACNRKFNPNYTPRTYRVKTTTKPIQQVSAPCAPRSGGEDRVANALRRLGL